MVRKSETYSIRTTRIALGIVEDQKTRAEWEQWLIEFQPT